MAPKKLVDIITNSGTPQCSKPALQAHKCGFPLLTLYHTIIT